jgi:hypothetical protein
MAVNKIKGLFLKGAKLAEEAAAQAADLAKDAGKSAKELWDENKDGLQTHGKEALDVGREFASSAYDSVSGVVSSVYYEIKYSDSDINKVQKSIENQGGLYRELNRRHTTSDSIVLGGETLAALLVAKAIPDEIVNAYEAAYPNLAESVSFEDKVRELNSEELIGFVSGVKGKLFEQQYVEYLNAGNLPEGYYAELAESVTQPGWDIAITGESGEIASVLQAKATDSVSYVQDAIEKYPNIDIVTTEEVYSHLVMSGVSENISNGQLSNAELEDVLQDAVDSAELSMNFAPPIFALAFIAFTSYKDDSLTLYEKARSAGDRSGKTYLSYILGGGVAALTNTWWLGVLGTVASRILSDSSSKKHDMYEQLKLIEERNQLLLEKLKDG